MTRFPFTLVPYGVPVSVRIAFTGVLPGTVAEKVTAIVLVTIDVLIVNATDV